MIFNDENLKPKGFIDKETILKYVTEEQIFELVFGFQPKEYDYVVSPFRNDVNPGCWFQYYPSGKLKFTDFGSEIFIKGVRMINIDCFDAVQFYYKLDSLYETLLFIKKHLINNKELPELENNVSNIKKIKRKTEITIETRDFDNRDKIFWEKYGISKQNLIEDKVFPIKRVKICSKKGDFFIRFYDSAYCYTDFEEGRKKIYRPYQKGRDRFITSCNQNDIGGINKLPLFGKSLVITKSYKDYRVLKNQGLTVIWFQNEGMIPTLDILLPLCKRFNYITVFFDNDETGLKESEKLMNLINSYYPGKSSLIHLPIELLNQNIKDASDLIKHKGRRELINFLNENKVL